MTPFKLFLTATLCIASSSGFATVPVRYALRPLYAEESAAEQPEAQDPAEPSGEGAEQPEAKDAASPSEDSDILNSPAFLKKKVEVLEGDLTKLDEAMTEANAVYDANKAEWGAKIDTLNEESRLIQERLSKQSVDTFSEASVDVVAKMLNVIDTYDRAFTALEPSTPEEEGIIADYRATYDKILECFGELNVTKVETVGAMFDVELHQGVMKMPSDEFEKGVVCQEFAPGWVCGDKLIRPALVAVTA